MVKMNRSRVACMGLILCAITSACAPALDWRAVPLAQAEGLLASFPCKPEQRERHVAWPGVPQGVTMHLASCQTEAMTWAVSYVTLPDVRLVGPALQAFPDQMRQNLLAAAQMRQGAQPASQPVDVAQAVSSRDLGPTTVPGMTPMAQARTWQFAAQRADGLGRPMDMVIRASHFSHGLTVFQASMWRPAEAVKPQSSEDVADVFLHGFHFPV
jgi:hypothetical protein